MPHTGILGNLKLERQICPVLCFGEVGSNVQRMDVESQIM